MPRIPYLCQPIPAVCQVVLPFYQIQWPDVCDLQVLADGLVCLLLSHHQRHLCSDLIVVQCWVQVGWVQGAGAVKQRRAASQEAHLPDVRHIVQREHMVWWNLAEQCLQTARTMCLGQSICGPHHPHNSLIDGIL